METVRELSVGPQAAAPGLTAAQAERVSRSSMSTLYVALIKWEELHAWVAAHPEDGSWPLTETKEGFVHRL